MLPAVSYVKAEWLSNALQSICFPQLLTGGRSENSSVFLKNVDAAS